MSEQPPTPTPSAHWVETEQRLNPEAFAALNRWIARFPNHRRATIQRIEHADYTISYNVTLFHVEDIPSDDPRQHIPGTTIYQISHHDERYVSRSHYHGDDLARAVASALACHQEKITERHRQRHCLQVNVASAPIVFEDSK